MKDKPAISHSIIVISLHHSYNRYRSNTPYFLALYCFFLCSKYRSVNEALRINAESVYNVQIYIQTGSIKLKIYC